MAANDKGRGGERRVEIGELGPCVLSSTPCTGCVCRVAQLGMCVETEGRFLPRRARRSWGAGEEAAEDVERSLSLSVLPC